jgi:hypothetical protein
MNSQCFTKFDNEFTFLGIAYASIKAVAIFDIFYVNPNTTWTKMVFAGAANSL